MHQTCSVQTGSRRGHAAARPDQHLLAAVWLSALTQTYVLCVCAPLTVPIGLDPDLITHDLLLGDRVKPRELGRVWPPGKMGGETGLNLTHMEMGPMVRALHGWSTAPSPAAQNGSIYRGQVLPVRQLVSLHVRLGTPPWTCLDGSGFVSQIRFPDERPSQCPGQADRRARAQGSLSWDQSKLPCKPLLAPVLLSRSLCSPGPPPPRQGPLSPDVCSGNAPSSRGL